MGLSVSDLVLPQELNDLSDQIRRWILVRDLQETKESGEKKAKGEWIEQWRRLFLADAEELYPDDIKQRLGDCKSKLHGGIVLVELVNFTPYLPMATGSEQTEDEQKAAKQLKKCKLSEEVHFETLADVAEALGFDRDYPKKLKDVFKKAAHQLQGGWTKTIAYAAGGAVMLAIGGAIAATGIGTATGAAMGYSGAAAVAAGLAFLGGGSIAAGGLGMAGGFAVIVMTGGLVGAGAGIGGKKLIETMTKEAALNEGAKMRVVMDEVVVQNHKDVQIHQEVLRRQRESIMKLHEEIDDQTIELARAKEAAEKDKERIKKLEQRIKELGEIVSLMERSVELGRETLVQQAVA